MTACPACQAGFPDDAIARIPCRCAHCGSQFVGPYCDLRHIGGGAMGDVYQARRPDMGDRTVAIKIPKVVTEQLSRRFEHEIAASARLQHENIVRVFDRGVAAGVPFLVMEFVDGRPLSRLIEGEHPLACQRVVRILHGVAAGLAHAAQWGIVNRDLKPENILLTALEVPKILDYGLALMDDRHEAPDRMTRDGTMLGTTAFMSPEQAADPHVVTILADVYALGCTAYYALTKSTPFKGTLGEILQQHAEAARPSVRDVRPDVPVELDRFVQRMMAIEPKDRPLPDIVVAELDGLLPQLAAIPPSVAAPSGQAAPADAVAGSAESTGYVDVRCPDCGEQYHLRASSLGRWMFCTNADCGARFKAQAAEPSVEAPRTMEIAADQPAPSGLDGDGPVVVGTILEDDAIVPPQPHGGSVGDRPTEILDSGVAGSGQPSPAPAEPEAPAVVGMALDQDDLPPQQTLSATEPVQPPTFPAGADVGPPDLSPPQTATAAGAEAEPEPYVGTPLSPTLSADDDGTDISVLPASAIVGGSSGAWQEPPPQEPEPQVLPARRKKKLSPQARFRLFLCGCVAVMAIVGGVGYWLWRSSRPDPEEIWAKCQEDYQLRKWKPAETGFKEFAERFPENPHAAEVPFFLDMCDAGRDVFSDAGDPADGLQCMQKIFLDYRDTAEYEAYLADLFAAQQRLIERFVDQCKKTAKPVHLDHAREAYELLQTVAQAMKDDWVPGKAAELLAMITETQAKLDLALARDEIEKLANDIIALKVPTDQLDASYRRIQELIQRYNLQDDKDLEKLIPDTYRSEIQRVVYAPVADLEAPAGGPADYDDEVKFVVWDAPVGTSGGEVFLAMARGVLYAFDADGGHLWSRRLGYDSHRLPIAIRPSDTSPDAFIAVSTIDNSLLALDKADGHVLWTYHAGSGQELSAPLTISRYRPASNQDEVIRGLLPTANGEIHVLELARGRRIGRFQTGFPMTVGGTFDPQTQLVFFPADRQRVFALDPAVVEHDLERKAASGGSSQQGGAPSKVTSGREGEGKDGRGGDLPRAAASVLFTGHPSGSLRSAPVVVGRYLILTESSDLSHTKVRAFEIIKSRGGFPDPLAKPVSEQMLCGWSWFTPPATPDRITVVTDHGDLGVCGVNLDNPDEALYPLIEADSGQCPSLSTSDPFRSLAIHSDEHLLWLMAGGVLREMALDVLNQKVKQVWPEKQGDGQIMGIPLHEATMDRSRQRIYLTTKAPRGDRIECSAVNADTGRPIWQHQLGVTPAADPVKLAEGRYVLVDRTGRLLHVAAVRAADGAERLQWKPDPYECPPGATGDVIRLDGLAGSRYLVLPLDGGKRLAVRTLSWDGLQSGWQQIDVPDRERLQGTPAVWGQHVVIPASDGRVHRVRLDGQPDVGAPLPFAWMSSQALAPGDQAQVYLLREQGPQAILLIDGNRARWLQYVTESGVPQWKQQGPSFLAKAPLVGAPLVHGEHVILVDADHNVYQVPRDRPIAEPPKWSLDGRMTDGPFVQHDRMFLVLDDRRVACYAMDVAPAEQRPAWVSEPLGGRICGRPVPIDVRQGPYLLVTDQSGKVTILSSEDGRAARVIPLGTGAVPACAAVALGTGRILAPLADGTLLWRAVPHAAKTQVARAEQ